MCAAQRALQRLGDLRMADFARRHDVARSATGCSATVCPGLHLACALWCGKRRGGREVHQCVEAGRWGIAHRCKLLDYERAAPQVVARCAGRGRGNRHRGRAPIGCVCRIVLPNCALLLTGPVRNAPCSLRSLVAFYGRALQENAIVSRTCRRAANVT